MSREHTSDRVRLCASDGLRLHLQLNSRGGDAGTTRQLSSYVGRPTGKHTAAQKPRTMRRISGDWRERSHRAGNQRARSHCGPLHLRLPAQFGRARTPTHRPPTAERAMTMCFRPPAILPHHQLFLVAVGRKSFPVEWQWVAHVAEHSTTIFASMHERCCSERENNELLPPDQRFLERTGRASAV